MFTLPAYFVGNSAAWYIIDLVLYFYGCGNIRKVSILLSKSLIKMAPSKLALPAYKVRRVDLKSLGGFISSFLNGF